MALRGGLLAYRQRLALRSTRWALRRQGADSLPLQVGSRRLYIVPTRSGLGFAALTLVCLFAGLNYANGMALLLAFVLGGFGVVALHQTHRQLLGTRLLALEVRPGPAGSALVLQGQLQGAPALQWPSWTLGARLASGRDVDCGMQARRQPEGHWQLSGQIPAGTRRGRWRLPPLVLATTAPFGLFRTWTWLQPPVETWVTPRPAGTALLPRPRPSPATGASSQAVPGADEWHDLRPWRDGDSPRQVAWSVWARGGPLLVREFTQPAGRRQLELGLDDTPGVALEAGLSQLAQWLNEAQAAGVETTLHLPGLAPVGPGLGPAHLEAALRALAEHEAGPAMEPT
jgi:uncharacterized protein (DUF58 family)